MIQSLKEAVKQADTDWRWDGILKENCVLLKL